LPSLQFLSVRKDDHFCASRGFADGVTHFTKEYGLIAQLQQAVASNARTPDEFPVMPTRAEIFGDSIRDGIEFPQTNQARLGAR
jgi:hypothetical protein